MTDKLTWWRSLTDNERGAYSYPRSFAELVADTIPRYRDKYQGNEWAARGAMKKILDGVPFPDGLNEVDGRKRVDLYRAIEGWAVIRDMEEEE